jgi:hypothetical protein
MFGREALKIHFLMRAREKRVSNPPEPRGGNVGLKHWKSHSWDRHIGPKRRNLEITIGRHC